MKNNIDKTWYTVDVLDSEFMKEEYKLEIPSWHHLLSVASFHPNHKNKYSSRVARSNAVKLARQLDYIGLRVFITTMGSNGKKHVIEINK